MHRFRCAVPTCENTHQDTDKKFLQAPKQEAIRSQWFKVLGVPVSTDENAFICEDHFVVEDKDQGYSEDEDSGSGDETDLSPNCETSKRKLTGTPSPNRESSKGKNASPPPSNCGTSKRKLLNTPSLLDKKKKKDDEDTIFSNRHQNESSPSDAEESSVPSPTAPSSSAPSPAPVEDHVTMSTIQDDSSDSRETIIKQEPDHNYDIGICHESADMETRNGSQGQEEVAIKIEPDVLDLSIFNGGLRGEKKEPHSVADDCKPQHSSDGATKPQSPMMDSPYLEILDQPEQSYRFRYKRESSKPHGPLKGRSHLHHGPRTSFGPKVKLCNFHGSEAILRVWLFCGDGPSPHQLVTTIPMDHGMGNQLMYEPHAVRVNALNDFTASFDKLNILHVVCGELEYQKRYYHKKVFSLSDVYDPPSKLPPFDQAEMKEEVRRKEKDIACLKIEAFAKVGGDYSKICEVYSEDIKNKKSPKTNDLRILKQSHEEGSCRGNQQVFIFTEKLIKEVNVEFFEEDECGEVTWSSKASFKESDIHKQVAISFLTPPYRDLHIRKPVPVFFRLVRTTDGAFSFNRTYRYIPANCPCEFSPAVKSPVLWPRKRECTSPERIISKDKFTQVNMTVPKKLPQAVVSRSLGPVNYPVAAHLDTKLKPLASRSEGGEELRTAQVMQEIAVKSYPGSSCVPNAVVPNDTNSSRQRFQAVPKLVAVSLPLPLALNKARIAPNSMFQTRIVRKLYRIEGQEVAKVEDTGLILHNSLPTPMSSS